MDWGIHFELSIGNRAFAFGNFSKGCLQTTPFPTSFMILGCSSANEYKHKVN